MAARRRARRSARPRDDDLGRQRPLRRGQERDASASSAAIATPSRPTARARSSTPSSTRSPPRRRRPARPRSSMPRATPPGLGTPTRAARSSRSRSARASSAAPRWTVTVLDAHGAPVASNSGSGARRRLDLERRALGRHARRARDASSPTASRPATRPASSAPPLLASLGRAARDRGTAPPLALAPAVISPDGDGVDDKLAIGYTLAGAGDGHARRARGRRLDRRRARAGRAAAGRRPERALGRRGPAGLVADGTYTVRLHVTDALGQVAERSGTVTVIRAVRKLQAEPRGRRAQRALTASLAADAAGRRVTGRARSTRVARRPRRRSRPSTAAGTAVAHPRRRAARHAARRHLHVRAARADRGRRAGAARLVQARPPPARRAPRAPPRARAQRLPGRCACPRRRTVRVLRRRPRRGAAPPARRRPQRLPLPAARRRARDACASISSTRPATSARAGPFRSSAARLRSRAS